MTAANLRELFMTLMNLDLSDLERAGVIAPDANGGSDWTRFNNDIGMFVVKLPSDRREKLASLINEFKAWEV